MKQAVGELFLQMMTLSRRYQYRLMQNGQTALDFGFQKVKDIEKKGVRVVYQGLEGAYSHGSGAPVFRGGSRHVPCAPVRGCSKGRV